MGRALKIQKTGTNNGITYGTYPTVYQPALSTNVDVGFPNFGSLTDPEYNTPVQTLNDTQFLGVVGGAPVLSSPSATYPEISPQVNIALPSGSGQGVATGRIIRQKGAHKFLVSSNTTVNDEDMVVGASYMIITLDTTNWQQMGAPAGAAAGTIFTCTAVCASPQNGTGVLVGQCILSNTATPAAGYMSISYSVGDSSAVYASYITNKWVRDWNGMTYQNYAPTNYGTNVTSNENFYVTNFFTDEGTVTWSGAEIINSANAQNGSLQLAQITNITS
jgi:hypothetical protein